MLVDRKVDVRELADIYWAHTPYFEQILHVQKLSCCWVPRMLFCRTMRWLTRASQRFKAPIESLEYVYRHNRGLNWNNPKLRTCCLFPRRWIIGIVRDLIHFSSTWKQILRLNSSYFGQTMTNIATYAHNTNHTMIVLSVSLCTCALFICVLSVPFQGFRALDTYWMREYVSKIQQTFEKWSYWHLHRRKIPTKYRRVDGADVFRVMNINHAVCMKKWATHRKHTVHTCPWLQ